MALDPIILALSIHGRIYCGMSAEDAVMIADKTVEVAGAGADEVDLLDAFDDVWAASLTAGIISEGDNTPIHPIQERDTQLSYASDDDEHQRIREMFPKDDGIIRPARYKNKNLIATKKRKKNKRRHWDKGV
jgi:hypothetical protein